LHGLHLRLDLVHGSNGHSYGSNGHSLRYGDAGAENAAAKGTDNRQIANIALPLLSISDDALEPFQCPANRGRGNLRRRASCARRAQVGLVRERVFTLGPGSKKL
jgi:hypothetical protein